MWQEQLSFISRFVRLVPLCFLLLCQHGVGQEASSFRSKQWTAEQGLPHNSVRTLLQTRDGCLWVGTMFGLVRFDGVEFEILDQGNLAAFQNGSDSINELAEDTEGNLWIATASGLVRHSNGIFTRFTTADGLPHNTVLSLAPSHRGGVWVGTHSGLGLYKNGQFVLNPEWAKVKETVINSLAEEASGRLWVAHQDGNYVWSPATGWEKDLAHPFKSLVVSTSYADRLGRVWLAAGATDVYCMSNSTVKNWKLSTNLAERAAVTSIFEGEEGQMYFAVRNVGLFLLETNSFRFLATEPSLAGLRVQSGLTDVEGNLWLGMRHEGLLRLQHKLVKTYGGSDEPEWNKVWTVSGDAEGTIWMGTDRGVQKLQNGELKQLVYQKNPRWRMFVGSILVDSKKRVWVAPRGDGLMQVHGEDLVKFYPPGPDTFTPNLSVEAMYEDKDGSLWLGTDNGLWHLTEEKLRRYLPQDGLAHRDIRCVLRDSDGRLWIGTHGGGLSCLDQGLFRTFTEQDGLPHGQVHCLFEDSQRTLWVGTQLGLVRWKDGKGTPILRQHGLFDNCINHIQEDDAGLLWLSCNRGVFSVPRQELLAFTEGRLRQVNCMAYGEADGMLSNETNGEHQPSGWKGPDGRLWFPTQKGLTVFDPRDFRKTQKPVPVVIEQVLANKQAVFEVLPLKGPATNSTRQGRGPADGPFQLLPADRESIEVHYAAHTFVAPEKVRYRYMLENYDKEWREAGPQRLAVYTNLRPGGYRFKVLACNHHGVWNKVPAVFAFSILPHFYETQWFYGGCILAVTLAGLGIHHYRVRVVRQFQELKAQAALADQRARIARDMHDDLGANLSKIALLNEVVRHNVENKALLQNETAKIAAIAHQTVDSLSELVWAANPKYDTLENLVSYFREFTAQFFEDTSIQCCLEVPSTIPPLQVNFKLRRHLFLVIKEALHNILKHARASRVDVRLAIENGCIRMEISDNGVGLDRSASSAGGNGLHNMRQRIGELQGTFKAHSREPQGTRLQITVPLSSFSKSR